MSRLHAVVRWSGGEWVARDLASRNGTWIGDSRLEPQRDHRLHDGAELIFGGPAAGRWRFEDTGAPKAMAVHLETGRQRVADGTVLALPSVAAVEATVYLGPAGWTVEEDGEPCPATDGGVIEAGGPWRLYLPGDPWNHCGGRRWRATLEPDRAALQGVSRPRARVARPRVARPTHRTGEPRVLVPPLPARGGAPQGPGRRPSTTLAGWTSRPSRATPDSSVGRWMCTPLGHGSRSARRAWWMDPASSSAVAASAVSAPVRRGCASAERAGSAGGGLPSGSAGAGVDGSGRCGTWSVCRDEADAAPVLGVGRAGQGLRNGGGRGFWSPQSVLLRKTMSFSATE